MDSPICKRDCHPASFKRRNERVSSYLSNFEDIFQTVLGEQFQINSHVSPFDSHMMVIGELTDLSGSQKLFKSSSSIDVGKINEPGYIFGMHIKNHLCQSTENYF